MSVPVPSLPSITTGPQRITPTDVSQFIRLEQCERYLRFRLHERQTDTGFMREFDVAPQSIPPILSRSGTTFEQRVEQSIAGTLSFYRLDPQTRAWDQEPHANTSLLDLITDLKPGDVCVVAQATLEAHLGRWFLTGIADLIRLEQPPSGRLRVLVADIKSSTAARVEHRLQIAFYHRMLARILDQAGIQHDPIDLAVLYRGPAATENAAEDLTQVAQREAAWQTFGSHEGLLERVEDVDAYLQAVDDLALKPASTASRILSTPFDAVPFHITTKCDGCQYNEFCMKHVAATDDLSLIPFITVQEKQVLQRAGVDTVADLASLKELRHQGETMVDGERMPQVDLVPASGKEAQSSTLSTTWSMGPKLDPLIHRAKRYRKARGDELDALAYMPNRGYGSLPYSDADHNPNLIRIFLDAQHDFLEDRLYLASALVVANQDGVPTRRRSLVHLADQAPTSDEIERDLLVRWVAETIQAVIDLAAPDAEGESRAPLHLITFDPFAQQVLLAALGRHTTTILGATALYDLISQPAAFDSSLVSNLAQQIAEHKNYPLICQSLPAVATYRRFQWSTPETDYRSIFRERIFDNRQWLDGAEDEADGFWYASRARFNNQIPLEYAYAAWNDLDVPSEGKDLFEPYRQVTPTILTGFAERRLAAMEHISADFPGNRQTQLTSFDLSNLAAFQAKAPTLAQALVDFITIERHVELTAWKQGRLPAPEQRVLGGESFMVQYREEDQAPEIVERMRENLRRSKRYEHYAREHQQRHPGEKVTLTKDQRSETDWSAESLTVRLHVALEQMHTGLDNLLDRSTLRDGDRLVLSPRWTFDSRLPEVEQRDFTPTAKQLLYAPRVSLERIEVERDADGRATDAWVHVQFTGFSGGTPPYGFTSRQRPLEPEEFLTLDPSPDAFTGAWQQQVAEGLVAGQPHPLYTILTRGSSVPPVWPESATTAQQRFLAGLEASQKLGLVPPFEPGKQAFIGSHGASPVLLVQGPPGTGKSYTTAFAILARIQGAMAAGIPLRVGISCKTHAAIDVLMQNVLARLADLHLWMEAQPERFDQFFDRRLLDLPVLRLEPRGEVPDGVTRVPRPEDREKGAPNTIRQIEALRWGVVCGTPSAIFKAVRERYSKHRLFGHAHLECLVLDEASQISIPEAMLASLPLAMDGRLIVVGDHRQMPPIVQNDWAQETRRTFQEFRTYSSLFETLLPLEPPMIRFEESFRLHADMAEFLRREIYHQDGINYHSNKHDLLPDHVVADPFVAAVLTPAYPMIVVIHDEANSQQRNAFEQALMTPVLELLAAEDGFGLDPRHGLGVVVPHRAQRAALQEALPVLSVHDPGTGTRTLSAVDTVERFQGDEREVIFYGATESDRAYLLSASKFLMEPRRLNVALSRAKRKLVVVAARSVFEVFSADEETFANAQLWKNLLRRTCTELLWRGERDGVQVEVWGKRSTAASSQSLPGDH